VVTTIVSIRKCLKFPPPAPPTKGGEFMDGHYSDKLLAAHCPGASGSLFGTFPVPMLNCGSMKQEDRFQANDALWVLYCIQGGPLELL